MKQKIAELKSNYFFAKQYRICTIVDLLINFARGPQDGIF